MNGKPRNRFLYLIGIVAAFIAIWYGVMFVAVGTR